LTFTIPSVQVAHSVGQGWQTVSWLGAKPGMSGGRKSSSYEWQVTNDQKLVTPSSRSACMNGSTREAL
jgi:hypothetical protein